MDKKKSTLGSKIFNAFIVLLIILLIIPDTRSLFHQGLMKLGFFKPNLEKNIEKEKVEDVKTAAATSFKFSDQQGNVKDIEDLKGKVVFVNLWATWCPPCRAEMPSIQVLYNKFKNNPKIEFLLLEIDHEIEKAATFMEREKLDMPISFPESNLPSTWVTGSIPVTIVLDKEGKIAGRHEGMADYSTKEIEDYIQSLINK